MPAVPEKRLIVVSNRLPITLEKDSQGQWSYMQSSGGLVSSLIGLKKDYAFVWIGWPGIEPNDDIQRQQIQTTLYDDYGCIPVFLETTLANQYCNSFCTGILWPILHYLTKKIDFQQAYWEAYKMANERFASVILENVREGDMIWIHDYHLMVLAGILRTKLQQTNLHSVKIGFFLHTPFPSFDIFRILPVASELIQGLLANDLVAFHTYDYMRHFISTCTCQLGAFSMSDFVIFDNRKISVQVIPIGIDPIKFIEASKLEEVHQIAENFVAMNRNKIFILGVERLDYIKGVQNKLLALEKLFEKYPQYVDNVVYIQIAVPSRTSVDEYKTLRSSVNELVGHINGVYGNINYTPIHYLNKSVNLQQLVALYSISDVCVISSSRDGMNLVAYEYVAARENNPGVLIVSEFAGASNSLDGSIIINPWNIDELSESYHEAISMPPELKKHNFQKLFTCVSKQTATAWGETFVSKLQFDNTLTRPLRICGNGNESLLDEHDEQSVPDNVNIKCRDIKNNMNFEIKLSELIEFSKDKSNLLALDVDYMISIIGEVETLNFLDALNNSAGKEHVVGNSIIFANQKLLSKKAVFELLSNLSFIFGNMVNINNESIVSFQDSSWKDAVKSLLSWYTERFSSQVNFIEEDSKITLNLNPKSDSYESRTQWQIDFDKKLFRDLLRNAEMNLAHQPVRVLFTENSIEINAIQAERQNILKRKLKLSKYKRILYLSSGIDWTHYFVNEWNEELERLSCTFDNEMKFASYQLKA